MRVKHVIPIILIVLWGIYSIQDLIENNGEGSFITGAFVITAAVGGVIGLVIGIVWISIVIQNSSWLSSNITERFINFWNKKLW